MREIAQHITDLVENSARAGARRVEVTVEEDSLADLLVLTVADDGPGMDPETVSRATDPFFTSRTCRKVGLGLPLVAATAERCGGTMKITSGVGNGTTVAASFRRSHIDRPPLGNLHCTLMGAIVGHPDLDIRYRHRVDGRTFEVDSAAIKRELEGVPLTHPSVLRWLERYVEEGLAEVGVSAFPAWEDRNAKAD